jgi:hypothetical protein
MATTSPAVARTAVDALLERGVPFAFLHGEDELARGEPISDVDLVLGVPAETAIRASAPAWADAGLLPVVLWPYDLGGNTLFLANADASEGVQLDFMHDRFGHGRLRLRSDALLQGAARGDRWPRVAERQELTYLLAKRRWKGQRDRAVSIAEHLERYGGPDPQTAHQRRRHHPARAGRALQRLRQPIGFWADVLPAPAPAVAERFGRFLVRSVTISGPRQVLDLPPVLLRPGLAVTSGWRVGPHLRTDEVGTDAVCRRIVAGMSGRLSERIGYQID